jgi:hypothetical protein
MIEVIRRGSNEVETPTGDGIIHANISFDLCYYGTFFLQKRIAKSTFDRLSNGLLEEGYN